MELIDLIPEFNLYEEFWKIYTKTDSIPPQFISGDAVIDRAIVSEGAEIFGEVHNSVLLGFSGFSSNSRMRLSSFVIATPKRLASSIGTGSVSILPPYEKSTSSEWYTGTANAIYQNLQYMEYYNPDYVL